MLEQIEKQKQDQWITTVGNQSLWSISFNKKDLFNETSARSLYFVNNKLQQEVKSDTPVILDDDRNLFDRYLEVAIQDVLVLLSRRIPQSADDYPELMKQGKYDTTPVINDSYMLEVTLVMSENHDKNLIQALRGYCKEYLVKKVLEMWFGVDFGSAEEPSKINHILQFRRRSAARRVRPLL